jgi:hypothetical protein
LAAVKKGGRGVPVMGRWLGKENEKGAAKSENAPDVGAKPLDVLKFPWTEVSVFSVEGLGLAGGEVESDSD